MSKDYIRHLYAELRGYLSQAPMVSNDSIFEKSFWEQYNGAIELLQKITEKDYSRFIIKPGGEGRVIYVNSYRQKLGGIIATLHSEYFSDEPDPLGAGPETVISQSQQQAQAVNIQMILDVQSKIDENINKYEEGSKEKGFLKKVRSSLSSISNVIQLVSLLLNTAKEFGISVEEILRILLI